MRPRKVMLAIELGVVFGGLLGGEICLKRGGIEGSANLEDMSERVQGSGTICFSLPAWMSIQGLNFVRGMLNRSL